MAVWLREWEGVLGVLTVRSLYTKRGTGRIYKGIFIWDFIDNIIEITINLHLVDMSRLIKVTSLLKDGTFK